jgi:hypothetical protein
MLKMVFLVVRRHGMDIESFREYWREMHAPIAANPSRTTSIRSKPRRLGRGRWSAGIRRVCGDVVGRRGRKAAFSSLA